MPHKKKKKTKQTTIELIEKILWKMKNLIK